MVQPEEMSALADRTNVTAGVDAPLRDCNAEAAGNLQGEPASSALSVVGGRCIACLLNTDRWLRATLSPLASCAAAEDGSDDVYVERVLSLDERLAENRAAAVRDGRMCVLDDGPDDDATPTLVVKSEPVAAIKSEPAVVKSEAGVALPSNPGPNPWREAFDPKHKRNVRRLLRRAGRPRFTPTCRRR